MAALAAVENDLRALAKLAALVALASCAACDRPRAITSCDADLGGVWTAESGAWMLVDHGATLEAFPLFPDAPAASPGVLTAPRVLDLARTPSGLAGTLTRRFMLAGVACPAIVPVHVTACTGSTLELVLADPAEPAITADGGCAPTRPPSSRRERWTKPTS